MRCTAPLLAACAAALVPAEGRAGNAAPFCELSQLRPGLPGDIEIPTLSTSDGHTIYCVYSNNTQGIYIQATRDSGLTWSDPVQIMEPGPRYTTDANILVDGDRLIVVATHVIDLPEQPGHLARSEFLACVSDNGGQTWSEPQRIPVPRKYVSGCVNVPVWLEGDTVVMPYSWDVPAEEATRPPKEGQMWCKAGALISEDRGRTWTPGADIEVPVHPMGADEPAFVRLSNGDLFAIIRTGDRRPYEAVSHDGGRTWADLKPSRFFGFNSPAALLRLRDGAIVRAWDDSPTDRFPLVVALSTDDCQTWTPQRTVTEPTPNADGSLPFQSACYPSIAEAADGTILLAWWQRTTEGRNSVMLARTNRAWIEEPAAWPKPQTIVAFGDSVTRGVRPGVTEYQTFRHLLQTKLREQGRNVRVVSAGVGGHTTSDGLARIELDVLAQQPALTIVMFGLNDAAMVDGPEAARTAPRVSVEDYSANLRTIVSRVREAGSKVLLCTPNPMTRKYDFQHVGAYAEHEDINFMLIHYVEATRQIAAEMGVPLLDVYDLFMTRPGALDLLFDGVHPFVEGHQILADALLEKTEPML